MKKIIIVIMMVMVFLSLTACGKQEINDKTNTQTETIPEYVTDNTYVYVDPETGVNYLIYDGYNRAGMSVRYNSDGYIMITK